MLKLSKERIVKLETTVSLVLAKMGQLVWISKWGICAIALMVGQVLTVVKTSTIVVWAAA